MKNATQLRNLKAKLQLCMKRDRHNIQRSLNRLTRHKANDPEYITIFTKVQDSIKSSTEVQQRRVKNLPKIHFQNDLPIHDRLSEITETIKNNQVVILTGETGSGKTTQLPKICLSLGLGKTGYIGHTQPRRIAARSIAQTIANDLNSKIGEYVGYKIRFSDKTAETTYVKCMTDGILLSEIYSDPYLNAYDALIIDEAHERSLNIDFLLGYCKRILPKRPDLKIIVTSATIDIQRFSEHFSQAPIIEVSGRTYPVDIQYRSLSDNENMDKDRDLQNAIQGAIEELERIERFGDVLVFLSTERDIRDTAAFIKKCNYRNTDVLSLYSRLAIEEQKKIFHTTHNRRIILATNVAETSITIPGIKFVIDCGMARISRYSYRSKVQRLPIEKISQSSANQRAGRCGRLSDGLCLRLYSENDFAQRSPYTEPEILRTNLASVILQMEHLKLGHIADYPFIDPPDVRFINDGYKLLFALEAVDENRNITKLGKTLAGLPIDPKLGKMVISAHKLSCLNEILIIASALSVQDPRDRPHEQRQKADQIHQKYTDEQSDFLTYLNIWENYQSKRKNLTKNQLKKYCSNKFLSIKRMAEWTDIHKQLKQSVTHMQWQFNQAPAQYEQIHGAILSGLIANIGIKSGKFEYEGQRNSVFYIHPSSGVKKSPRWVVASELVHTTRLFARFVAKIDPIWVEEFAAHLIQRQYSEAYWDKNTNKVNAYERIVLNGLIIVSNRRIDYGRTNPIESRKIFIQSALVEQLYRSKIEFITHNRKQIMALEKLDAKLRRPSLSIDDTYLFNFYLERIPQDVFSGELLENWVKSADKSLLNALRLNSEILLNQRKDRVDVAQFPNDITIGGNRLKLTYHFEPGNKEDGVSVTVPVFILGQLPCEPFDWLIPGLLKEKLIAMIKCLPKALRKQFVPVPHYVEIFLHEHKINHDNSLLAEITEFLNGKSKLAIDYSSWRLDLLPEYYSLNIKVINEHGKLLDMGRDISTLKRTLAKYSENLTQSIEHPITQIKDKIQWDFGDLPSEVQLEVHGKKFKAFPTIIDMSDSVSIELIQDKDESERKMKQGIKRLYYLSNKKQIDYIRKNIPQLQVMCQRYVSIGSCNEFLNLLVEETVNRTLFSDYTSTKSKQQFEQLCKTANSKILGVANHLSENIKNILDEFHAVKKLLVGFDQFHLLFAIKDIGQQLDQLVNIRFIVDTEPDWMEHIPRFLQGIVIRLEKLRRSPNADKDRYAQIEPQWKRFLDILQQSPTHSTNKQFIHFRWMLEEMRISLFAQELKTSLPISIKRLDKQFDAYKKSMLV